MASGENCEDCKVVRIARIASSTEQLSEQPPERESNSWSGLGLESTFRRKLRIELL